MKKVLFLFSFLMLISFFSIQEASAARIRIPVGSYEKLSKIKNLPEDEIFTTNQDEHFDLGVRYTVYQICWIPIYQQGETTIIGYIDNDNYVQFDEEDVEYIATIIDTDMNTINKLAKLPFWDAWGGKIIVLILVGLIIVGIFSKSDDEEENEETEESIEKEVEEVAGETPEDDIEEDEIEETEEEKED